MILDFINSLVWFFDSLKSFGLVFIKLLEFFFTTPMLPFTILAIISAFVGKRRRYR